MNATEKITLYSYFLSFILIDFILSFFRHVFEQVYFKHFVPVCIQMVNKTRKDQLSIEKNNYHTTDVCVTAQYSTVKPVLNVHSENDRKLVFKIDYRLM